MSGLIYTGDCRDVLTTLPDESVHCVVTSPPYWGLRDYGVDGQIGLESDINDYVSTMVAVFREVRRVLRKDGTLWLNLGDSYASAWPCSRRNVVGQGSLENGKREARSRRGVSGNKGAAADFDGPHRRPQIGLKEKDLCGIPWRVAFALQTDGWWLRQDIVWSKPNPMPESVTDRCTKAHEYMFLLSKAQNYYFDHEAIKEPIQSGSGNAKTFRGGSKYTQGQSHDNTATVERDSRGNSPNTTGLRNRRSIWHIATKPFKGAHSATFPPALVEPCILAGCPEGGTVLDPFGGVGTVGLVAEKLKRNAILIELNPEYVEMAFARITADAA